MSFISRVLHHVSRFSYRRQIVATRNTYLLEKSTRSFSCNLVLYDKLFKEYENKYAYDIMRNKGFAIDIEYTQEYESLDKHTFMTLIEQDWSTKSHTQIFEVFPKFGVYCKQNGLCISNTIFDSYIDNLTDSLSKATDEELISVFYGFNQWPETPSIRTRNYIEVWVALDDACRSRLNNWSPDEMLTFISLFYMLNVTKGSDSARKMLDKLASKAKKLTPNQLVQTIFFVGVMRSSPFDMHNLEIQLNNIFPSLSVDELAIISMGFFKSKTPIRNDEITMNIIEKVIDNSKNIHEISLASLLKIIRYSLRVPFEKSSLLIYKLLDTLQHEIYRLSIMCNVHLALLGTNKLVLHEDCLNKIANMVLNNFPQTRLKDLERLVLTYGTFIYVPKTDKNLFDTIIEELRKPERETEINKHGRSFACCLQYLSLMGLHPIDLINKVLNPDFLHNAYGKQSFQYGREILALSNSAQIFHTGQLVHCLSDKESKSLSKKYTDYVPSEDYKKQYNISEKMVLDVMKVLRTIRGGKNFVIGDHILTHHQRGDIILCNTPDGIPVPIADKFSSNTFGLIRRPPDDNTWIVLVIAGRNGIITNIKTPTGQFHSKIEELTHLGYCANLILWNIYSTLETFEQKEEYLSNCINDAIKSRK